MPDPAILSELAALPTGTIVCRVIRGKERFYHQWRENGETRNHYLSPGEIMPLRVKLERRKYLLRISAYNSHSPDPAFFHCDILTGSLLTEYAAATSKLKKRDIFSTILPFLKADNGDSPSVNGDSPSVNGDSPLFLFGPDGVGKTTLLRQLIHALPPTLRAKTAYIRLTGCESAMDLSADFSHLRDLGFRRILVDDAEKLMVLPGAGLTVLLAGTFPHASFKGKISAFDIGFISFRELNHLTGVTDTSILSSHGGTLRFYGDSPWFKGDSPWFNGDSPLSAEEARMNDRFVLDVLASVTTHRLAQRFAELSGLPLAASDKSSRERLLGVQSFRRFAHSVMRIDELLGDDFLERLGAAERKTLRDTLLRAMDFRLLEDAVWNELRHRRTTASVEVHRLVFAPDACGFVVANREELVCEVFVVTTDAARTPEQLRHLDDPARLDAIEHRYGLVTERTVLYNGRDARLPSGVSYRNLFNFLVGRQR